MKSLSVTFQVKASEKDFPVVLFIIVYMVSCTSCLWMVLYTMLYKGVLIFLCVVKSLKC